MEFSAWLSAQRASITRLQVESGQYEVTYLPRSRRYDARIAVLPSDPVTVDRLGGTVRISVRRGAAEYTFEPVWISGRGLSVTRLSPSQVSREVADDVRGRAMAALQCAAERVYQQHRDIAMESGETDAEREEVLLQLAHASDARGGEPIVAALRPALLAELQEREDGAELAVAPAECACVACGRGYAQGEPGPVVLFGTVAVCRPCLRPAVAA